MFESGLSLTKNIEISKSKKSCAKINHIPKLKTSDTGKILATSAVIPVNTIFVRMNGLTNGIKARFNNLDPRPINIPAKGPYLTDATTMNKE